ncbi:MAG: hypothetical protein KQJ78_09385 [Deltaproteobacteria bacterium]|nr:hypothetical protein [Deltaproteobacteria bacterium]
MIKIDQILPGNLTGVEPQKKPERPTGAPTFDQFLEKAAATQSLQAGEPVIPLDASYPLNAVSDTTAPASQEQLAALERTERLLDTLEEYSQALGDQRRTLKEVSPLLTRLQEEARELASRRDDLAEDDQLKEIVDLVLATAQAEDIKFQRGDYVG